MKNQILKEYLSKIGQKGGKKSRRKLNSETAKKMVKLREAKKLFKKHHVKCFWSYDPDYNLTYDDIPWVSKQLMKNGDQKLWLKGFYLCR